MATFYPVHIKEIRQETANAVSVVFDIPEDLKSKFHFSAGQYITLRKEINTEDDPENNIYPMPINANDKDEVFVGRIRRDESQENTLNLWIVADNLRKGAATNTVQIAEYLIANHLV